MEDVRLAAPNLFEDSLMRSQWGVGSQQQGGHGVSDARRMMLDPMGGQRAFSMWAPTMSQAAGYHGNGSWGHMDASHLRSSPVVVERPAGGGVMPSRGHGTIGNSSSAHKPWTSFDGLPATGFGGWEHGMEHHHMEPVFGDFTPSGSPSSSRGMMGSPASEEIGSYVPHCGSQVVTGNTPPHMAHDPDLVGFSRSRSIENDLGQNVVVEGAV